MSIRGFGVDVEKHLISHSHGHGHSQALELFGWESYPRVR